MPQKNKATGKKRRGAPMTPENQPFALNLECMTDMYINKLRMNDVVEKRGVPKAYLQLLRDNAQMYFNAHSRYNKV